jgi:hypothetical protein
VATNDTQIIQKTTTMASMGSKPAITAIEQRQVHTSTAQQIGSVVDTACTIFTQFLFSTLVLFEVLFVSPDLLLLLLFHFQFTFPVLTWTTIITDFLQ